MQQFENTVDFAQAQDANDPLKHFREEFHIPLSHGKPCIYLCGNSLGLQPKSAKNLLEEELASWQESGVEGHFEGKRPWMHYHKNFKPYWKDLIGANEGEVVVMNNLTVNIHLLMVSFYRPNKYKYKVLMEAQAFPSDQYAVASQVQWHGYDPNDAIVEIYPRDGEHTLRTEDILVKIEELGSELALVVLSGVQYYTGQYFNIKEIAKVAHHVGAKAGFDLAHAVGNVPMNLHDWQVDFATWCSYKYLNSGPGSVSGVFIHEKHATDTSLVRFAGWWGHDETTRFKMGREFHPTATAEGWQLSNAPVFSMAVHLASLAVFQRAGMDKLREKSQNLTGYLFYLLQQKKSDAFEVITPNDPTQRGCQVSMLFDERGKTVFKYLSENGVVADWREPNVIRVAPVPLYNTYWEVYEFSRLLMEGIKGS